MEVLPLREKIRISVRSINNMVGDDCRVSGNGMGLKALFKNQKKIIELLEDMEKLEEKTEVIENVMFVYAKTLEILYRYEDFFKYAQEKKDNKLFKMAAEKTEEELQPLNYMYCYLKDNVLRHL